MLKRFKAYGLHHVKAASMSLRALLKKPLPSLMTIVVIAITLSLPALFWVFTENVEQLTAHWKNEGRIALFTSLDLSTKKQAALLKEVRSFPGVGQAVLKTPEDAMDLLQAQEGMEDIRMYLPKNPLPAVIEVVPALSINTPGKVQALANQMKRLPYVDQAKLDIEWVTRLHAILHLAKEVVSGLVILLGMAVLLIVGNTLRLAIQSHYDEIQVLKLIGASDAYIARPFLYSGALYGFFGALFAIVFIHLFLWSLRVAAQQLANAYHSAYPFMGLSISQALMIVFLSAIIGWLGARLSVKRQLSLIEPSY